MSQASTTMATTTTHVTVVCSLLMTVTMAPPWLHFQQCWSAWCGFAATEGLWRCCWPCHCAVAAISVSDASSGLCQLCHCTSTGKFLFQSWASHHWGLLLIPMCMCWCLFWCMPSAFRCHAGWCIHLSGSTIGVLTIAAFWSLPIVGICTTWWWSLAHTMNALSGCSLYCFE